MFKHTLNELRVTLEICPQSPLLIKEGRHFEHREGDEERAWESRMFFHRDAPRTPDRPRSKGSALRGYYDDAKDCFDMAFVFTQDRHGTYRFYLPGSSVRGVIRRAAEQIIGRWCPMLARESDPFDNMAEERLLSQREQGKVLHGSDIYAQAGPLDRCFGHVALRGRWVVQDAWMQDEQAANVIVRDGVGINRQTGAAQNSVKFQFEAITGGVFETTLTLVNYELWQLGLLAHVLAMLDGGDMRLGYGTRRGLGRVGVRVTKMLWRWYGAQQPETTSNGEVSLPSLAQLAQHAGIAQAYGWRDNALTLTLPLRKESAEQWLLPQIPQWTLALPNDWDGVPWSRFGPLLPTVLEQWQREE